MGSPGAWVTRSDWEFDYDPLQVYNWSPAARAGKWVVAASLDVDPARVAEALADLSASISVAPIIEIHPLFWYLVELSADVTSAELNAALDTFGISARYVAPARHGTHALGSPAHFASAAPRLGPSWRCHPQREAADAKTPGRWFLEASGVALERAVCGTGAGTRLAVIDNDAGGAEHLDLDAEILVGVTEVPRTTLHGAMMVGWAVGATIGDSGSRSGVAPDACVRLYCVPKPGEEVFNLPAAIVHAVNDGADVVLCTIYVDGLCSPMLDDALTFARRLGRNGKGSAVVMPTSREMSSVEGSVHASLSLGMSEPASDPRVFCIGPSSRDGRWFLWRDKRGKLHPFANRGPALRWLAPGDDMAHPLLEPERVSHAESSGAASIAAGVILLVLAANPQLSLDDVDRLLTDTATKIDPAEQSSLSDLADPNDLNPLGVDKDGHNAKHGYGGINASLACAAARDPFAASFITIGETRLGLALASANAERGYSIVSELLAKWLARELLRGSGIRHGVSALARGIRLSRPSTPRRVPGALARQWLVALREYILPVARASSVEQELLRLEAELRAILNDPSESGNFEQAALSWIYSVLGDAGDQPNTSQISLRNAGQGPCRASAESGLGRP